MQTHKIISNTQISNELFILEIEYDSPVQAGQFFMLKPKDHAHILPRPISIFEQKDFSISFLIRTRGFGSKEFSSYIARDKIELFGSLGKGFNTTIKDKTCLMISGGEGIAPMHLLSHQLKACNNLKLLAGFRYEEEAAVLAYFQYIPFEYTATDHKNIDRTGFVTDLLEKESEPDIIYTCGPTSMMKAVYDMVIRKQWNTHIYVSMESRMACGVGACVGCIVKKSDHSPAKICTDGPVFRAEEIFHA